MIKANAHKYPVSAMCRVLQVNRSTYYYESKQHSDESGLVSEIKEIFRTSRNNYGTRKIKKELMNTGKQVSRRRIGRIMKQEGLVSNYTIVQFKPHKDTCGDRYHKEMDKAPARLGADSFLVNHCINS